MNTNTLFALVVIGGVFYVGGQYVASQPERERQASEADRTISVTGQGMVSQRPDTAMLTLGTQTEPLPSAEAALAELTEQFNTVLENVRGAGVAEEDVRTSNFSIQPQYDFADGRQRLRGYVASENVTVTIRDLSKIGEVIGSATTGGANQIGGVSFKIDDDSPVRLQAEEEAIEDARQKAEQLARALGARLGPVRSYEASNDQPDFPIPFRTLEAAGGDSAAPELPAGTTDTNVTVTVVFELR